MDRKVGGLLFVLMGLNILRSIWYAIFFQDKDLRTN